MKAFFLGLLACLFVALNFRCYMSEGSVDELHRRIAFVIVVAAACINVAVFSRKQATLGLIMYEIVSLGTLLVRV